MRQRADQPQGWPDQALQSGKQSTVLYTAEERRRRDASRWTLVQGVLAPLQFVVFLVSVTLVVRFLTTGEGLQDATASIVVKTFVLYTIMVTGSIWEKEVFGVYLFARPFFWEDVFSMAVYAAYVINAAQFLLKLRAARLQAAQSMPATTAGARA